jgi:hypothetical protein
MTVNLSSETDGVRCAPWTREHGVDPIGSIGTPQSFIFIEWPLPWPRDIGEVEALVPLYPELDSAGGRLQGLVPLDGTVRRLLFYGRPEGAFTRFYGRELVVAPGQEVDAARRLLAGDGSEIVRTDVMVCTHGRRDRCCGSMGTTLAMELLANPGLLGSRAQTWRTSHTGGHRFAPTALIFPEGTCWAFADADLLGSVSKRQGSAADVVASYRGGAGMGSSRIQVIERAVLAEVGWGLLDQARWGEEEDDGTVRLHVEGAGVWEGRVVSGRVLPAPDCGGAPADARKTNAELILEGFHQIS